MRVLVFGTFDHLHPGHLFLFAEAEKRGALHIVVARDTTVERIKGRRPDQSEEGRCAAIRDAVPHAEVSLGDGDDYLVPVRAVRPDLIVLGYDQKLPPGISMDDFPCPVERAEAYKPEEFKSSLRRRNGKS